MGLDQLVNWCECECDWLSFSLCSPCDRLETSISYQRVTEDNVIILKLEVDLPKGQSF